MEVRPPLRFYFSRTLGGHTTMRRTHFTWFVIAVGLLVATGCSSNKNATVPGWSWSSLNPFSSKSSREAAPPYPARPSELAQRNGPEKSPAGFATVSSSGMAGPMAGHVPPGSQTGFAAPQTSLGGTAVTNRTASGFAMPATGQADSSWGVAARQSGSLSQQGPYDAGPYGMAAAPQVATRNAYPAGNLAGAMGSLDRSQAAAGALGTYGADSGRAAADDTADLYNRAVSGSRFGTASDRYGLSQSNAISATYPQAGASTRSSIPSFEAGAGPSYPVAGSWQQSGNADPSQNVTQAGLSVPAGFGAVGSPSSARGVSSQPGAASAAYAGPGSSYLAPMQSASVAPQNTSPQNTLQGEQFAQANSLLSGGAGTASPPNAGQQGTASTGSGTWNPGGATPNMPGNVNYQPGRTGYEPGNTGYSPPGTSQYQSPAGSYRSPTGSTSSTQPFLPGSVRPFESSSSGASGSSAGSGGYGTGQPTQNSSGVVPTNPTGWF